MRSAVAIAAEVAVVVAIVAIGRQFAVVVRGGRDRQLALQPRVEVAVAGLQRLPAANPASQFPVI